MSEKLNKLKFQAYEVKIILTAIGFLYNLYFPDDGNDIAITFSKIIIRRQDHNYAMACNG
jgi:hypothetical protein